MDIRLHRVFTLSAAALAIYSLGIGSASAFTFETESGAVKGSLDSTLTFGIARRMENPDCGLVGDPSYQGGGCGSQLNTAQWSNGDNGNLNFKKGDIFSLYLKGTHELLLKLPDGYKFLARGTWLHDWKADGTDRTELASDAKTQLTANVRLLDLWVSRDFNIGEQNARVRFGNQVVNWGESIFWMGGINVTNALDLQKLLIPGTQLKEAVLPAPMLSFATSLGKGFNVDTYYQFAWERNVYPAVGGYWSASDIYGKGRQPVYGNNSNYNFGGVDAESIARINGLGRGSAAITQAQSLLGANNSTAYPIQPDDKPHDGGQYGIALHYKPDSIRADFGFYYINYHDKFPVLKYDATNLAYQWKFLENRKLYGVSTNFPLGDWAIGSELSYRPKDAVALSSCYNQGGPADLVTNGSPASCDLWVDRAKTQFHLTGQLQLTPSDYGTILGVLGRADTAYLTLEGVFTHFAGVSSGTQFNRTVNGAAVMQVPAAGYYYWSNAANGGNPGNPDTSTATAAGVGSGTSWGYAVDFNWTYDNRLIPGWLVTPGVTLYHAVKGDTPVMYPNFLQGAKSANFYIGFVKNPAVWQAGINYTTYFGGDKLRQPYGDRDFLGGYVSYNF